ncbi:MAG: hypothetical protein J6T04_00525 [Bacteroidales bacterium]|nr:hypothetical protein [Bacteroidales bacterium]
MATNYAMAHNRGKVIQKISISKKIAENITFWCISQNRCLGFGRGKTRIYETHYSSQQRNPGGQGGGQRPDSPAGMDAAPG